MEISPTGLTWVSPPIKCILEESSIDGFTHIGCILDCTLFGIGLLQRIDPTFCVPSKFNRVLGYVAQDLHRSSPFQGGHGFVGVIQIHDDKGSYCDDHGVMGRYRHEFLPPRNLAHGFQ
jgi:hypothetical protein